MKKKLTAIFLLVTLLLQVIPFVAVGATEEPTLISHYSFDNALDSNGYYADEATSGEAERMSFAGDAEIQNGIAVIPATTGSHLETIDVGDAQSLAGKTLVFKMKFDDNAAMKRVVAQGSGTADTFRFDFNGSELTSFYCATGGFTPGNGTVSAVAGAFRIYVMQFDYDATAGEASINVYMSNSDAPESGTDFVALKEATGAATANPWNNEGKTLRFGRRFQSTAHEFASYWDDIRLYDGIASLDYVAAAYAEEGGEEPEPETPVIVPDEDPTIIAHYDFNSSAVADAENANTYYYADRAVSGNAENMVFVGGAEVVDGVATVPDTEGAYMYIDADEGVAGDDTDDLAGKTLVFKVKVDATTNLGRVIAHGSGATETFRFQLGNMKAAFYSKAFTDAGSTIDPLYKKAIPTGEYRVFVMQFGYDGISGKAAIKAYISDSENPTSAEDFIALADSTAIVSSNPWSGSNKTLRFGKRFVDQKDENFSTGWDDIKLYDGIASLERAIEDLDATVETSVDLVGSQIGETEENYFDVRLIAGINTTNVDKIGFNVSATYTGYQTAWVKSQGCDEMYNSLNANEDTGLARKYATKDYGVPYFFAIVITDIPKSLLDNGGYVDLVVSTYANDDVVGQEYLIHITYNEAAGMIEVATSVNA